MLRTASFRQSFLSFQSPSNFSSKSPLPKGFPFSSTDIGTVRAELASLKTRGELQALLKSDLLLLPFAEACAIVMTTRHHDGENPFHPKVTHALSIYFATLERFKAVISEDLKPGPITPIHDLWVQATSFIFDQLTHDFYCATHSRIGSIGIPLTLSPNTHRVTQEDLTLFMKKITAYDNFNIGEDNLVLLLKDFSFVVLPMMKNPVDILHNIESAHTKGVDTRWKLYDDGSTSIKKLDGKTSQELDNGLLIDAQYLQMLASSSELASNYCSPSEADVSVTASRGLASSYCSPSGTWVSGAASPGLASSHYSPLGADVSNVVLNSSGGSITPDNPEVEASGCCCGLFG